MSNELTIYSDLLVGIKNRVRQGQIKAYVAVNTELLATYWDIGKMIHERQQAEGWGKGVIPRLAIDLKNELSEVKGFSERNLRVMVLFYAEYQLLTIWQLPVAKLEKDDTSISQPSVAKLETLQDSIRQPPVSQLENKENSILPLPVSKLETTNESISPSLMAELEKPYFESFKYELTRTLPEKFKGSLPSVEEIENKLNEMGL